MKKVNVLVPMAGQTMLFDKHEYPYPKSLIEIDEKTMIEHVINNLSAVHNINQFIFVVNEEDCRKHHLDNILGLLTNGQCQVIKIRKETKGAACSALLAIKHINNDDELIIANGDQIFMDDLNRVLQLHRENSLDAAVIIFNSVHPRWSYVRLDENGMVIETAEKRPFSRQAIAGFFYFRQGKFFIKAAMNMIKKDASVNGSFFIAPSLNEMVLDKKRIGVYTIDNDKYHTFHSPQKINEYEKKLHNL
ncbi:MAG: glycosyltransferase family 2 protein [Thermodesulfobacteriota bacterium]